MTDEALPRLLTLMGSGETSPTMVKVHREILERLGARPVPSVLLDTPFGFQENANELTQRVQLYFRESLSTTITNASGIDPDDPTQAEPRFLSEALTTNIRRSRYVFSGPGSPSYALRQWQETIVPQLLSEKISTGGAVTFASAAALTLGALTVPVYEIYKVGMDPYWLDGLDLLSLFGIHAAVIPHYNNAEGGTHDTRFCYLGERRLHMMEEMMPDQAFVFGIDEHSSCTLDLDEMTATMGGIGTITIRKNGDSTIYNSGERIAIADLLAGTRPSSHSRTSTHNVNAGTPSGGGATPPEATALLLDLVQGAEQSFHLALAGGDSPEATSVILDLEQSFHEWSTDSPGQDDLLRARAALRAMIAEFGAAAVEGMRDPRERLAPFMEILIALRQSARAERRFSDADAIRDQLIALGIELKDAPEGTNWSIS